MISRKCDGEGNRTDFRLGQSEGYVKQESTTLWYELEGLKRGWRVWIMIRNKNSPRSQQKFALHPLIHTFLPADLTQDMVAVSQGQKCGLKYVMHILRA